MTRLQKEKLFYVDGIRHHAIVLAKDSKEALKFAIDASTSDKKNSKVLFGDVGEWEVSNTAEEVRELKLPRGYSIAQRKA